MCDYHSIEKISLSSTTSILTTLVFWYARLTPILRLWATAFTPVCHKSVHLRPGNCYAYNDQHCNQSGNINRSFCYLWVCTISLPKIPLTDEDYERFEEQIPALAELATREAYERALQSGLPVAIRLGNIVVEVTLDGVVREVKKTTGNPTIHDATLLQT